MESKSWRWCGVLTLFVVAAISYIDRINLAVLVTDHAFLAHIGLESGDRVRQGMFATVFLVGYGLSSVLLTPFCSALLGVRQSLIYGLAFWGALTFASPLAHGYGLILTSRLLLGIAEGPLYSLAAAYIKAHFTSRESGKPNSLVNMGTGIGLAIGYPLVSYLLTHFDWQTSFHVIGLVNIVLGIPLVIAFVHMPGKERHGSSAPPPRAAMPVRQVVAGAWQTRHLILITVLTSAALAYLWGSSNWLPAYLKVSRGFSLREMGWLASLPQYAMVCGVLMGGIVLDKLQRRWVPCMFLVGSLSVALAVWLTIQTADRYWAAAGMVAANFFWGLQAPAIPSIVQDNSRAEYTASAFGVVNGVGSLIAGLMPLAMGGVISAVSAGSGGAASGFFAGFALLIGTQLVVFICGLILWLRERAERRSLVPASSGLSA
ncbi:D-galactonate transporter [Collimonas arenae]|uniref:D-galactonate transporter n=1 Tax=Collimonas arenae TaxID=279058 RepID=A0A0A1F584_9BURK|nr:MFS transporter [Collimonas arenae]AIY39691.1 D-galactonate transporter [Collimonas arenae]